MARRSSHGISWQTIRLEGSLLLPDLLEQIAKNEAIHQKDSEYQIPPGLRMIEEIGRSYQIARALYADFKNRRQGSNTDAFQLTDTFFVKFMTNCLGWEKAQRVRSKRIGEYGYPVQKIAFEKIPITVAPYDMGLDTSDSRFGISGSKVRNRSLFQMAQEYLNALGKSFWGVISNGSTIRLLRSSPTLARPQYLEFDLDSMLEDDHYSEYALLWKILHVSRVYDVENQIEMTVWEEWRNETIRTGERVRDGMRIGVTKALMLLGSGFLANPENGALRQKLNKGELTAEDLYHQLLRLVYRFLFLFALEERRAENGLRLVFIPDPSLVKERNLYEKGYSLDRLRDVMLRRSSYNYYTDLWAGQKIVFTALAKGEKRLALPALGGLFSSGMCDDLDGATLDNATFLKAMESLRWARNTSGQYSYIDYKNMGTEELGSVYESLLELVPTVDMPARIFRFIGVEDDESTAGNVRKTTGSYYTPSFLVDQLIKTALVPVIEKTVEENGRNTVEALLSLSVIDPSCGSGHFILAAARKIAEYVALARDDDGVVTPSEYRRALRDVISRCIYGVDLNPMALELTKMALWLEGYEPGKPLSFLDEHLLCGNSLLGVFDLSILDRGIPKDAFKQLTGDDKEYCSELAKENALGLKIYRKKFEDGTLFEMDLFSEPFLEDVYSPLDSMPEDDVDEVEKKAQRHKELKKLMDQDPRMVASDIYIGAFLMQKRPENRVPTSHTLHRYKVVRQPNEMDLEAIKHAREVCRNAKVLHWPFAFPKIFSKGGFDVVLGNPPWERITLKEQEFFATRHPKIAQAPNASKRKALIEGLATGSDADKLLYRDFLAEKYQAEALSNFVHVKEEQYGQYPLSGIGDTNLYALFAELVNKLREKNKGRAGIIVPTGIATDDSTKRLFGSFVERRSLVGLYDFENRGIFPSVHNSYKFSLLTLGSSPSADFACFLHSIQDLEDDRRHFELTAEDFHLINPNTHTLPIFRSKMDADLAKKIYRRVPVLVDESKGDEGNPWGVKFLRMFDMANDSSLFLASPEPDSYPLYEAKMLHQYDHRWATYEPDGTVRDVTIEEKMNHNYEVTPRYWVPKREVLNRIADVPDSVRKVWYAGEEHELRMALATCGDKELQQLAAADNLMKKMDQVMDERSPKWLMGWRDIVRATDERTVIASVFPRSAVGHTETLFSSSLGKQAFLLLANMNSIIFDYCARQKVGGTHLSIYTLKQLPVLVPSSFFEQVESFIIEVFLKLSITSRKMAVTFGYELNCWDIEQRAILRAELDALFARLYGLNREELMYILDPESVMGSDYPSETFPGLKNKELREYGEYRTMRLVLEAWDRQEGQPELWQ
ncbi:MAG: Eco57I restriction-modification methylase domain-containing protein [Sphaerochaeta sp.]|jgi:hypothetical protein